MNKQTVRVKPEDLLGRCADSRHLDMRADSHYLLQCHRIALDFGPRAAERAMELFSNRE